jgi:hypothetical protein
MFEKNTVLIVINQGKRYFTTNVNKVIENQIFIPQIVYQPRLINRNLNFNPNFTMAMNLLKRFKK